MDPTERDATVAHQALERGKPNYKLILEIVCTKSPEELLTVKRTYHSIHKRALEEDIASHTNGKIRKVNPHTFLIFSLIILQPRQYSMIFEFSFYHVQFLVGLVSTYKYHGDEIDEETAFSDANMLHDEIQDGESVHEEIIRIISTRSKEQLLATFNYFKNIHGTSITKVSTQ